MSKQGSRRSASHPRFFACGIAILLAGSPASGQPGSAAGADQALRSPAAVREAWVRQYGSGMFAGNDLVNGVGVDAAGNVYVTGTCDAAGGATDCITISYDSRGTVRWVARYSGGTPGQGGGGGRDILVAADGSVYVAAASGKECVTLKYDGSGNIVWVQRDPPPEKPGSTPASTVRPLALALDGSGIVYLIGAITNLNPSYSEYFLASFEASGETRWIRRWAYRGSEQGVPVDLAADRQGNVYVAGSSTVGNARAADFALSKYDGSGTLQWVAHAGNAGSLENQVAALAIDGSGSVYVTGSGDAGAATGLDYLTVKFDASGKQVWSTRYGGSAADIPSAIALDERGYVYVTGTCDSDLVTVRYDPLGAADPLERLEAPAGLTYAGEAIAADGQGAIYVAGTGRSSWKEIEYVLVKHDSAGSRVWVKNSEAPEAGDGRGRIAGLALDGAGDVAVAFRASPSGLFYDYGIAKYDGSGAELWRTSYSAEGNSIETLAGIAVDASGNAYVAGTSLSALTGSDYAIVKYDAAGNQMWVARYSAGNSPSEEQAAAVALDGSGYVYVTGWGSDPTSKNDYLTLKYDGSGRLLWTSRYRGISASDNRACALALDASGNVYVTGSSGGDYATVKYSPSGAEQWVAQYDGPGAAEDAPSALSIDAEGNVYVTGASRTGSAADFATVKYGPSGRQQWVVRHSGPPGLSYGATALALDRQGNVLVTGVSRANASGVDDYVTLKCDPSGAVLWIARRARPAGSMSSDLPAVAVDDRGNVFVTGGRGCETVMYDSAGIERWVSRYSDPEDLYGDRWYSSRAIAPDRSGGVIVAGGGNAGFLTVRYDASGKVRWGMHYRGGAPKNDFATAIAVHGVWNIYVGGTLTTSYTVRSDSYVYRETHYAIARYLQEQPLLANPGFESGVAGWEFWTDGEGSFDAGGVDDGQSKAGRVLIQAAGTNTQLYQAGVTLEPASRYRVRFQGRSSGGRDVAVLLHKDTPPYTNYGLWWGFDLGTEWETHEQEFVTKGFSEPVTDGRLRFWLAPFASAGDEYLFDDVELEYVGPAGGGSGTVAGIGGEESPRTFSLLQNYPNPFNPTTTIEFALPRALEVRLSVFDILGRESVLLVDGRREAGGHRVRWDASGWPSGVYFYRLRAGNFVETRRLILVR